MKTIFNEHPKGNIKQTPHQTRPGIYHINTCTNVETEFRDNSLLLGTKPNHIKLREKVNN